MYSHSKAAYHSTLSHCFPCDMIEKNELQSSGNNQATYTESEGVHVPEQHKVHLGLTR